MTDIKLPAPKFLYDEEMGELHDPGDYAPSDWAALYTSDQVREAVRLNATVPDGWMMVPVEPTPEMLAAGAVSVLPQASNDIELARSAAKIVLLKPGAPSVFTLELLAATIATMAPYYRAMLSAAPAAPAAPQPARCPQCNYQHGHQIGCENNPVDIALKAQGSKDLP